MMMIMRLNLLLLVSLIFCESIPAKADSRNKFQPRKKPLLYQNHEEATVAPCKPGTTATIPEELGALRNFFSFCGGYSSWVNKDGWTSSTDACLGGWFGVCCDDKGHVTELNLPSNGVVGELWHTLLELTGLTALRLSNNHLTGNINTEFFQMKTLKVLDLRNNQFEGSLPDKFETPALVNLTLSNNKLGGLLPTDWKAPALEVLSLSSNMFEGTLPTSLQTVTSLKLLDLSVNSLSGMLVPGYSSLKSLEKLWLFENEFDMQEMPNNWMSLTEMRDFQMDRLTGIIPKALGLYWKKLEVLTFVNGRIIGGIPESLCDLKNLKYLQVFYNNVSGSIPECMCSNKDSSLISIDLSNNKLTGSIPDCMGNLRNLNYLYLSNNGLTGPLPRSLGQLTKLYSLDVSTNCLSGTIPSSFSSLQGSLNQLDLSTNYLSTIDSGLESLFESLSHRSCNLNENPFSCPVPTYSSSCNARCSSCNTGGNHTSCTVCLSSNQYCGWCNEIPNCLGGYEQGPYYPYTCKMSDWIYGKDAKCP